MVDETLLDFFYRDDPSRTALTYCDIDGTVTRTSYRECDQAANQVSASLELLQQGCHQKVIAIMVQHQHLVPCLVLG